jgi:aconitate hydratase
VIAAITSCTNTSNPVGDAGRRAARAQTARRARPEGEAVGEDLARAGLQVVTDYLAEGRKLLDDSTRCGFHLVGYGCTTCIGNSGPLAGADRRGDRRPATHRRSAVLSGNRNFEGRVHPEVQRELPRLAAARRGLRAGRHASTSTSTDRAASAPTARRKPVFLKDIWPSPAGGRRHRRRIDRHRACSAAATPTSSRATRTGSGIEVAGGPDSTPGTRTPPTCSNPPYFDGMAMEPERGRRTSTGARVLALLGDSITTDHISPAGHRSRRSPGRRVPASEHGVPTRRLQLRTARAAATTR